MSEAKKRIINSSIELFNCYGFSNVSQHKVANYLEISPGNVTYHFKKKSDILEHIFIEYENSLENIFSIFFNSDIMLNNLELLVAKWFEKNYYYRFLFSEIENIIRASDKVGEKYKSFVLKIDNLFLAIYKMLIRLNYTDYKNIQDLDRNLTPILMLVTTFHLSHQKIIFDEKTPQLYSKSIELFYQVFNPFLNEMGKQEFRKISS